MHVCPSPTAMTLHSCQSYSHTSPMSNIVATAKTGREHNGYCVSSPPLLHQLPQPGTKSAVAHKWAEWLRQPYGRGVPNA